MLGVPLDIENKITYETVRLNLTGYTDYDTNLPWFTLCDYDGKLASLVATYVDDDGVLTRSEQTHWMEVHQV